MKWPGGLSPDRPQALLLGAAVLLGAALANPTLPAPRALFDHLVVLDITQSMNVADMQLDGRPATRLAATKAALRQALLALPCGSKLGWAVFTEHRSYVLVPPVEVCAHLDELRGTLAHIDNTMAWMGGSEVAKGLNTALRVARELEDAPSVVFVTDGHEAPPVNPGHRPTVDSPPREDGRPAGVIVGVGGLQPAPIPKSDPSGRPVGWWGADDVMQTDPYSQGRGGSVGGERMVEDRSAARPAALPGAAPGQEHLSSLREAYLRLLADEAGLRYVQGDRPAAIASALTDGALARPVRAPYALRPWLVLAALALLVARHRPSGGWRAALAAWRRRPGPLRDQAAGTTRRLPS